jgi:phospholipid/cholesterol/gamma-HCH transport system ATP-binding protein
LSGEVRSGGAGRLRGPAPAGPKIRLAGVRKSFGGKVVLDGLDLEVREGESLVVIGGSGTGKSVLLKHMIGLIEPDSGRVEVDGVGLASLDNREITEFRRRFGMAFQEGALFDSMTVWENVAFPLQRGVRRQAAEIQERVARCLELVHLDGAAKKMPAELSGGMRRRVGLARAIVLEPQILLLDEPTTGLDPVISAVIEELIIELRSRLEATTVSITHDMHTAFRVGDRVGMLHRGRIIALAPPEEFQRLEDPRVRQFLNRQAEGPLTENNG